MKKLLIYLLQLLQIRATIVDLRISPNFLNFSSWSIILILLTRFINEILLVSPLNKFCFYFLVIAFSLQVPFENNFGHCSATVLSPFLSINHLKMLDTYQVCISN